MELDYYQAGLERLEQAIGNTSEKTSEFDSNKGRLIQLLDDRRSHGDDERIRHDINVVLNNFNSLSWEVCSKNWEDLCAESRQQNPGFDNLGAPSSFDLVEWDQALESLLLGGGLKGISVAWSEDSEANFPQHLQTRLRLCLEQWGGSEVFEAPTYSIQATFSSIEARMKVLLRYKRRLTSTDVLLKVLADDEQRLRRFWDRLSSEFSGPYEYRFLVLIITQPGVSPPESIKDNFPSPEFSRADVFKWVASLANGLNMDRKEKERLVKDWVDVITRGCTQDQRLHTDTVYEHIAQALDCLKTHTPPIPALYNFLEDWK